MFRKYSWTTESHAAAYPNTALFDGKRRLSSMTERLSGHLARRSRSLDLGPGCNQLYGPDRPDSPAINMHSIRPLLQRREEELRFGSLNVKARHGIIEETPYVKLSELIQQHARKNWEDTLQHLQKKQAARKKCLVLRERQQKTQPLDISFNPLTFTCQKSAEKSTRKQQQSPRNRSTRSRQSNRENNIFFSKSTLMTSTDASKCSCEAKKKKSAAAGG